MGPPLTKRATGGAADCGWKVLGRAEHCPAPGALEGAELPVNALRRRGPEGYTAHRPLLELRGKEGLARGHGVGLFAFGGAYWPLAPAHSDPLWVRTCFGCVNEAPG